MKEHKKESSVDKILGGGKKSAEKKKKHQYKSTRIEHHPDGSHTVRHEPGADGQEMSYSRPDLSGVHGGLDEHLGQGMEAPQAASAGAGAPLPMAGAMVGRGPVA